ncbi:MAG: Protein N-acetyltransferase, RimJ/RimL family [Symbiobacteriaceae bacterium]|jgi:ribosomal-protein-alanine N-acetyltransferase|nr:Protein N-acetyltransferase, RimJ/RimL family [Symbiobacteriaceae bacterium]
MTVLIETQHLRLVPASREFISAVAHDRRGDLPLPVAVPAEWPEADLRDFLPTLARMLAADPEGACWSVWLMIDKATQTVVGDVGFKGAPDEAGRVEIGYSVLPAWRRRGYAFEAARALVDWALSDPRVARVEAECLEANAPSARVLEKLGMRCLGRSGGLIQWEVTR